MLHCGGFFGHVSGSFLGTPFSYTVCCVFFEPGKFLSILPVDPKLGKMLIVGAIYRCFDPVLTIVAGLSVRDPFLLPQDKKDVSLLIKLINC